MFHLFISFTTYKNLDKIVSVGCFTDKQCDVFMETGLTQSQCDSALAQYSDLVKVSCGNVNLLYSTKNMNAEKCTNICTSNGFLFGGLQG